MVPVKLTKTKDGDSDKKGPRIFTHKVLPRDISPKEPHSNKHSALTTNSQEQNPETSWPPSLEAFVTRCFNRSRMLSSEEKMQLSEQLQQLVRMAAEAGQIHSNKWDLQTVPLLDGGELLLGLKSDSKTNGKRKGEEDTQSSKKPNTKKPTSSKKQDINQSLLPSKPDVAAYDSNERKKQRSKRFESPTIPIHQESENSSGKIVGYCETLEKNYLRLTSAPKPSMVRPQPVLELALAYILLKYEANGSYSYVINQFKSMRQDLTVQHIKNAFAITVYETNGRVSLLQKDLGEFNQCQGQLKYLYRRHRGKDLRFVANELEFLVYRLLYMIITNNTSEVCRLRLAVNGQYSRYTRSPHEDALFALMERLFEVHTHVLSGNYNQFAHARTKIEGLELARKLLDDFVVPKMALRSLGVISRSYRKVPTAFLAQELAMSDDELDRFLAENKLSAYVTEGEIDCAAGRSDMAAVLRRGYGKVDIKGQI